jgi:LysR family glycine cleavage system transcriptional activator
MSDLPPLAAVRVFEAVARHGNFTRAAAELNMTQSAVSYQVKILEKHVGGPLFLRRARGVELTARGRQLDPLVRQAVGELARGFRQARESAGHVLAISTMQTIAGNWLAPRIGRFQLAHPGLAVRIEISPRFADFTGDGIDVAIRSGRGDWPGLASHHLFDQIFTPVASPAYLAREGRPASPADLPRHVLIDPTDEWWTIWFRAAGVPTPATIERPSVAVDTQQMAASVAMAGHGIALVTPRFEADCLASGKLVPLFDITARSNSSYYLTYPEENRSLRKVKLFRDWVLAEAKADSPAPTA